MFHRKAHRRWRYGGAALSAALAFLAAHTAQAQSGTPGFAQTAVTGGPSGATQLPYLDNNGNSSDPGVACIETLRGTGTRMGYALSHGGIIPASVSVTTAAGRLQSGRDYYIDAASGSVVFSDPVAANQSVRVWYRYVVSADTGRSPLGMSGFKFNLAGSDLTVGLGVSRENGLNFSTYGLGLIRTTSQGASINSQIYLSTPSSSNNNLLQELGKGDQQPQRPTGTIGPGRMVVEHLGYSHAGSSIAANYQNIGNQFSGFQSLRQQSTGDAANLATLTQLEKEKGLQRMGFSADLSPSKSQGLAMNWSQITDKSARILTSGGLIKTGVISMGFTHQSISQTFSRLNDLSDGDKAQWLHEKGITRNGLTLALDPGRAGTLNFAQNSFKDQSGRLLTQQLNAGFGKTEVSWFNQRTDAKFNRAADLTDAEKTALALNMRRTFDSTAQASVLTAADRAQALQQAGLRRTGLTLRSELSKTASLSVASFGLADEKGALSRSTATLSSRTLNVSYLDQRVSKSFTHLGTLDDFEKAQVGAESGIHKNQITLQLALNKGSSLGWKQLTYRDGVNESSKRTLDYATSGLSVQWVHAHTDGSFSRVTDLVMAAPDKQALAQDKGFTRNDLTAHLTAIKGLAIDSFVTRASNRTAGIDRNGMHEMLNWTGPQGVTLALNLDSAAETHSGSIDSRTNHSMVQLADALSSGIKWNLMHDSLNSLTSGKTKQHTVTDLYHLEMFRSKPTNMLLERKTIDQADGTHVWTTLADFNAQVTTQAHLHLNRTEIDNGKSPGTSTDTADWSLDMNKNTQLSGAFGRTTSLASATEKASTSAGFALKTLTTEAVSLAAAYSHVNTGDRETHSLLDVSLGTGKPLSTLGVKGLAVSAHMQEMKDQGHKQTQSAAAHVDTPLGNGKVTLDYGSTLDIHGNGSISRTVAVTSDPNPKLPIHLDLLYRASNLNHSALQLTRKYDIAAKLDAVTQVTYAYNSLPADPAGKIQMTRASTLMLNHALSKVMAIHFNYVTGADMTQQTETRSIGISLSGKTPANDTLSVSVSSDRKGQVQTITDCRTIAFTFESAGTADRTFSMGTTATFKNRNLATDLQANVDFKTTF